MSAAYLPFVLLAAAVATDGVPVRLETQSGRLALVLELAPSQAVSVARDGGEVVVRLTPPTADAPRLPAPQAPLVDLRLVQRRERSELRARVAVDVAFEVQREGTRVSVVFGPRPDEPEYGGAAAEARGDVLSLYRSLFPGAGGESPPVGGELGADGHAEEGLHVGPLLLRPALLVAWVDGETALGPSPQPVRDDYFQIEPRLGALMATSLPGGGQLRLGYEPVLRTRPALRSARRWAHEFDANLDQPLGGALALRGNAHLVWEVLSTAEVDPGREFFFALGRFRRERYGIGARYKSAGRLDLDLSASLNRVRFSEPAYFFDYDRRGLVAELGYELSPTLRAGLGYVYDEVPTTQQRREAASTSHGLRAALYGDLTATLTGEAALGYERRTSAFAGPGGERYRGLVASGRLTQEFSRSYTLGLTASRYTTLSAFESNAFYVSNQADLVLSAPLPLDLSGRAGVGAVWNRYSVAARALVTTPRRDDVFGWTVGLGRPLTRWGFVRADYRRDRRDSNLDEFDTTTWTFVLQLGVGYLGRPERR
jgi:hypothetical protein